MSIVAMDLVKESWWHRWLIAPVKLQLRQGISVNRVSWTVALGFVLGVFPIMGTTSIVCLLVGWLFRLNQALLHLFKAVVYPLHLALILVFIRLGERLYGVPLISFSIPELMGKFKTDPIQFARDFGMAAWHGVSAWLVIAPFAVVVIKITATPILRRVASSLEKRKEVSA
jgi:uncharacterized protein (DUF2062 family)